MASTTETQTFHLFPLLPKELRLQIWTQALPPPQLLELALTHRERGNEGRVLNCSWVADCHWTTKTPPEHSPLPYVCQEAREVFLSSYTRTSISDQAVPSSGRHVWMDYSRDMLYFTRRHEVNLSRWFNGQFEQGGPHPPKKELLLEFARLRYVAIEPPSLRSGKEEEQPLPWTYDTIGRIRQLCHYCPQLEECSLVLDGRDLDFNGFKEYIACSATHVPGGGSLVKVKLKAKGRLVDATIESCNQGGVIVRGEAMLEPKALESLTDKLKEQRPDLNVPTLRLKLCISDPKPQRLRKWDLYAGTCSIVDV